MARVRIPQYILRRRAKITAPIQKLPNEVFDTILSFLPEKPDKLSLLFSCRAFVQVLRAQKIKVTHGRRAHRELITRIGSGGNSCDWGYCLNCDLLRPTHPQKWAGGRLPFTLPEDYAGLDVSLAVEKRYKDLCQNWLTRQSFRGCHHAGLVCPDCYLAWKQRQFTLGINAP